MLLSELGISEVHAAISLGKPLLVPAGTVECHGNHLPLGTDTIIVEAVVKGVANRVDGVIAPMIDYGPTGYAVSGPERGTVDLPAEAFYTYAKGVLAGLMRLGFPYIFVVVHHQGPDLPEAAAFHFANAALFNELHQSRGLGWWGERKPEPWPIVTVFPTILPDAREQVRGDHAGQTETSLLLHLRPDLVDLGRLQPGDFWYNWEPGRESNRATARHGSDLLEIMVRTVADAVRGVVQPAGG